MQVPTLTKEVIHLKKHLLSLCFPVVFLIVPAWTDQLSPLLQTLFFLMLFISVCLSLHTAWSLLSPRFPNWTARVNRLHPALGILLGLVLLAAFGYLFFTVFSLVTFGILQSILTIVLMYIGLVIFVFLLSCFVEGITRQAKEALFQPVLIFVSVSYVVLTTFGILQLVA
ncbi:hypothetical protein DVG79_06440 [Exiguobacterium sp. RIT594]|nr:hypothetical protein DVG79_06440 [Exiguobacterium sp. RIT594]